MKGIFKAVAIASMLAAPAEARQITVVDFDILVKAIADVESGGRADAVGKAGERGLVQIKSATWRETSLRVFQRDVPYSRAFEPRMNLLIGRAYLQHLGVTLLQHEDRFQDRFLPLLVASYNNGPERIVSLGYSLQGLSPERKDYVNRVLNLHGVYASEREKAVARRPEPAAPATAVPEPVASTVEPPVESPSTVSRDPATASVSAGILGTIPVAVLVMGWAAYRRRRYVLATDQPYLKAVNKPQLRLPPRRR